MSSSVEGITSESEEEIKNSTAQNIPDLLRAEVGVHVNDIAGNRRAFTVDLRGFGETAGALGMNKIRGLEVIDFGGIAAGIGGSIEMGNQTNT